MRFLGMLARATAQIFGMVLLMLFLVICVAGVLSFVLEWIR